MAPVLIRASFVSASNGVYVEPKYPHECLKSSEGDDFCCLVPKYRRILTQAGKQTISKIAKISQ